MTHRSAVYRFRATFKPPSAVATRRAVGAPPMSNPDESRDEALQRLNARAKALEARQVRQVSHDAAAAKVSGYGYRLIGVLIGGVFVGLAFGAIADVVLGIRPWGMIVGVLVGFGVSIWMAVRSAQQMSAEVAKEFGPPKDLPFDDEDED